jgi:putative phage-type endonuclease
MVEQRTDEWRQARSGLLTCSRFRDVLGTKAARQKLAREVVFERLSGTPMHEVNGRSLTWGREVEDYAVAAFELETGLVCERAGLIRHPRYPFVAGSPDRLVGRDSGVEVKCPMDESVSVQTWLEGMPAEHVAQVQGYLWITGRSHWWYVSYEPRAAEPYRLYIERVPRNDSYIATLAGALLTFEQEVQAMLEVIRTKAARQGSK